MHIVNKILFGACAAYSLAGFALVGWSYKQIRKLPPIETVKKNRQN